MRNLVQKTTAAIWAGCAAAFAAIWWLNFTDFYLGLAILPYAMFFSSLVWAVTLKKKIKWFYITVNALLFMTTISIVIYLIYYGGDQGGIGMFFIHIFTGIGNLILLVIAGLHFGGVKYIKSASSGKNSKIG